MSESKHRPVILKAIRSSGENGLSLNEIAEKTGIARNTVKSYISQLTRDGEIYRSQAKRKCSATGVHIEPFKARSGMPKW